MRVVGWRLSHHLLAGAAVLNPWATRDCLEPITRRVRGWTEPGTLRLAVLNKRRDLHEFDGRPNAVETGHCLKQTVVEESLGGVLRIPHVKVDRFLPGGADSKGLRAQAGHVRKLRACHLCDFPHSLLIEA